MILFLILNVYFFFIMSIAMGVPEKNKIHKMFYFKRFFNVKLNYMNSCQIKRHKMCGDITTSGSVGGVKLLIRISFYIDVAILPRFESK